MADVLTHEANVAVDDHDKSTETQPKPQNRSNSDSTFIDDVKICSQFIDDFITHNFTEKIIPNSEPGFVYKAIGSVAPENPIPIRALLNTFDSTLRKATVLWKHPLNFGFLPAGNALANIYGDMLSTGIGGVGFSWTAQPALTESENMCLDWFAEALNLPKKFNFEQSLGTGGGSIQNSGSDAIFNTMVAARFHAMKAAGNYGGSGSAADPNDTPGQFGQPGVYHIADFLKGLVCFASDEAHSSVKKAAHLALVDCVLIRTHSPNYAITRPLYQQAVENALSQQKKPFYTVFSLGTAGCCAFDDLKVVGKMCKEYGMWCHVNASYAGNSFIVDQYRRFALGMEYADSINISPYKMLLGAPDLALLWVDNTDRYIEPFLMEATYLLNKFANATDKNVVLNTIDYRNYGVPLTRRMRSLKLFFVMRTYGVHQFQRHINHVVSCAEKFAAMIRTDERFELLNTVHLGVVVFRQRDLNYENDEDILNLNLLARLQKKNSVLVTPCHIGIHFAIRISINDEFMSVAAIQTAWYLIKEEYVALLDQSIDPVNDFETDPSPDIVEFMTRGHLRPVDTDTYNKAVVEGFRAYEEDFGPIIVKMNSRTLSMYKHVLYE